MARRDGRDLALAAALEPVHMGARGPVRVVRARACGGLAGPPRLAARRRHRRDPLRRGRLLGRDGGAHDPARRRPAPRLDRCRARHPGDDQFRTPSGGSTSRSLKRRSRISSATPIPISRGSPPTSRANVFGFASSLVGAIFMLLTIGLFTFYLTADGPRFRRAVLSVLPPDRQPHVLWTWEVAIEKTGAYLYSRLLLAARRRGRDVRRADDPRYPVRGAARRVDGPRLPVHPDGRHLHRDGPAVARRRGRESVQSA